MHSTGSMLAFQLNIPEIFSEALASPAYMVATPMVPKPEILEPLENITAPLQQTANLYCLAVSHGILNYKWTRLDNKRISFESSQFYTTKKTKDFILKTIAYQLQIPKVKLSDEGWYCCIATNQQGKTEKCAWLEVASKLIYIKAVRQ